LDVGHRTMCLVNSTIHRYLIVETLFPVLLVLFLSKIKTGNLRPDFKRKKEKKKRKKNYKKGNREKQDRKKERLRERVEKEKQRVRVSKRD
jgi:hypothetical protein